MDEESKKLRSPALRDKLRDEIPPRQGQKLKRLKELKELK
jgi:hypothetical protein